MEKKNISISVCVPAFNEEGSLRAAVEDLLTTLSTAVQKLEIIIVNDGSTDFTPRLAEQLARIYYQVKVIHHKINLGIGVCYRDALLVAGGEYFTWFPGDHENSAEEFVQCLPYLGDGTVVTCYHQGQDSRTVLRRWLSRSYTRILNKYLHFNLKYYNGLTIFPTSILRSMPLVADGFGFPAESLVRAIQRGCPILELLAPLNKRRWGKSKAFSLLSLSRTARDIFKFFTTRDKK